jgi:VWFA-related protein
MSFSMLIVFMLLFSMCKKDDDDDKKSPSPQPYGNMSDDTTTDLQVTIPRIELSALKSTTITLYLSVTDQHGNPFTNFNQYNFNIRQVCDGRTDTAQIASITFTTINEEGDNISAGLTMDYSGSMSSSDIQLMEQAVTSFVTLKDPDDYMEIIKFSDGVDVVQPYTSDLSVLTQAISDTYPGAGGMTAFCDAVYFGLIDANAFVAQQTGILPAVIGFTDGWENNSIYATYSTLVDTSLYYQIPVYTVGYGDADSLSLRYLAESTGGRYFYSPDASALTDLYSLISGQLKNLYKVSWVYNDPTCLKVWVIVKATYTCANGTFTAKVEKYFYPLKK